MTKISLHKNDDCSFQLKSDKGHTLLNSISFTNEQELDEAISTLQRLSRQPNYFERKTNHGGSFLFLVKNKQGKTIGSSMHYNSEAGMENGIKNLKEAISSSTFN